MDQNPAAGRIAERGIASIQFVLAGAMAMVMFVVMANLVVVQYGRGAIRSALEQGVRAGSVGGESRCLETASGVLEDLLGGAMADDLSISCEMSAVGIVARGEATFPSWVPFTPAFDVLIEAVATGEP